MSDVMDKLRAIVCERLDLKEEQLTLDSDFVEDLGADSLELVDLALAIEEGFGLQIKDTDYVHLKKMREAAAYVESQLMKLAS